MTSSVYHIWRVVQCPQDKKNIIRIFFALRNDNQNAWHSHHRYGNGKGRFQTDIYEILLRLTIAEIFKPTCQEKNVRFFFG